MNAVLSTSRVGESFGLSARTDWDLSSIEIFGSAFSATGVAADYIFLKYETLFQVIAAIRGERKWDLGFLQYRKFGTTFDEGKNEKYFCSNKGKQNNPAFKYVTLNYYCFHKNIYII